MELSDTTLDVGDTIADRYRIDSVIGHGGFGVVFQATQLNLGRRTAVKVMRPQLASDSERAERFRREALLAQRLGHPNTVRLYDYGATDDGLLFIALEYLEGVPLDEAIAAEAPFSLERTRHIAEQILRSLMEAHGHGIIHRDIKPQNIFLCHFSGAPDFVKVLDFGIAKTLAGDVSAQKTLTQAGSIVGTPSYMAPEQVESGSVLPATDLYALGLVMAEALTGKRVYDEHSPMAILMQHLSDNPVPLPLSVIESPLGPVIVRATAKDLESRYPSAEAMLNDLSNVRLGESSELVIAAQAQSPVTPAQLAVAPTEDSLERPVPSAVQPPPPRGRPLPTLEPAPPAPSTWQSPEPEPARSRWLISLLPAVVVAFVGCGALGLIGGIGVYAINSATDDADEGDDDRDDARYVFDDDEDERPRRSRKRVKLRKSPLNFRNWEPEDLTERLDDIGCEQDSVTDFAQGADWTDTMVFGSCGAADWCQFRLYRNPLDTWGIALRTIKASWTGVYEQQGQTLVMVACDADVDTSERVLQRVLRQK